MRWIFLAAALFLLSALPVGAQNLVCGSLSSPCQFWAAIVPASGTGNAQIINTISGGFQLNAGNTVVYVPAITNTGAVTVNVDASGVTPVHLNGGAVPNGGIVAGIGVSMVYNGTTFDITSFSGVVASASNLAGGAANYIPYQTGSGATSFITPVNNAVVVTNGSGVPLEATTLPGGLIIPLANATGLPISTGLTGAGAGVLTALGINIGSAGSFVTYNGALGLSVAGLTQINGGVAGQAALAVGSTTYGGLGVSGAINSYGGGTVFTDITSSTNGRIQIAGPNVGTVGTLDIYVGNSNFSTNYKALSISNTGTILLPNLATSSVAQTGTVCSGTGGLLTVDTTTTCLLSDPALKTARDPIDPWRALSVVLAMTPESFEYKSDVAAGHPVQHFGLMADAVAKVEPALAGYSTEDGHPNSVRYIDYAAGFLTGAIQAQQVEIAVLTARITALEKSSETYVH